MRLKALKSGKFANADPSRPHLVLMEMQHFETDEVTARNLIQAGWAIVPPVNGILMPDPIPKPAAPEIKEKKPHLFIGKPETVEMKPPKRKRGRKPKSEGK